MPESVLSLNSTSSIDSAQEAIQVNPLHDSHESSTAHSGDDDHREPKEDVQSVGASSRKSRAELVVPRSQRRGILSQVVLIPEYHDARDYPESIKFLIVFIIAFASITGPMGTSIMLPAIEDIVRDLNTTDSTVNVSVGIYLLSLGIFPLWWSSLSERSGRRTVYFISFTMFFAFSIGTSLSPTIGALIGLRVLQGGCSASVQAVGAGTIADLFAPQNRGRAMGWYYLGPLCGPFLAPILGGAVAQGWGWRATQWLLVIFSGCNTFLILFLLPETLRKVDNLAAVRAMLEAGGPVGKETVSAVASAEEELEEENLGLHKVDTSNIPDKILSRVASRLSQAGGASVMYPEETDTPAVDALTPNLARLTTNRSEYSRHVNEQIVENEMRRTKSSAPNSAAASVVDMEDHRSWPYWRTTLYDLFIRPTHSLVLLTHPPVALVIAYSAISFAVIYFFNMTISYEYSRPPYNMTPVIVGLLYIPNSVTYILASIIGGRWNDYLLRKYAKNHNGVLSPESRISWNVVVACAMFPPACLIFGWCLDFDEHWVTPLIGTALFGFASMLVIGATVTYLVDSLPGKGATGVALNNLIRQILGAVATFVVEPALRGVGPGILFSILMAILLVASGLLYILKWKGTYFRENYNISSLYEKL